MQTVHSRKYSFRATRLCITSYKKRKPQTYTSRCSAIAKECSRRCSSSWYLQIIVCIRPHVVCKYTVCQMLALERVYCNLVFGKTIW